MNPKRKKEFYYKCVKDCQMRDVNNTICYSKAGELVQTRKALKDDLLGIEPAKHVTDGRNWPHFIVLDPPTNGQKASARFMIFAEEFYEQAVRPEFYYKCLVDCSIEKMPDDPAYFKSGYIIKTQWALGPALLKKFELIENPSEKVQESADLIFPPDKYYQGG